LLTFPNTTTPRTGCDWKFCKKKMPPVFIPAGVKVNTDVYIGILQKHVLPWTKREYPDGEFIWQQDGAPCHTSKRSQEWLLENMKHMSGWRTFGRRQAQIWIRLTIQYGQRLRKMSTRRHTPVLLPYKPKSRLCGAICPLITSSEPAPVSAPELKVSLKPAALTLNNLFVLL